MIAARKLLRRNTRIASLSGDGLSIYIMSTQLVVFFCLVKKSLKLVFQNWLVILEQQFHCCTANFIHRSCVYHVRLARQRLWSVCTSERDTCLLTSEGRAESPCCDRALLFLLLTTHSSLSKLWPARVRVRQWRLFSPVWWREACPCRSSHPPSLRYL